jgi:hypothetical protein
MAGVFGLKKVYTRQRVDNWPESANYGYFGGGSPSIATVDRIDFSNETTSLPESDLTQGRWSATTVSNSNYGYFVGGYVAPFYRCTIDRLDFSTEIVAVPPVGNQLTQARYMMSGVSSPDYGYFAGGEAAPYLTAPKVATIDRLDFSTETMAGPPIHGINLTEPRSYSAGVFNRNYGYFAGDVAEIDRIDFSNDTTSEPGVTLTQSRYSLTSVSASNYGYFAGGTPFVDTIDRIDFSNETTSAPGNNLTQARRLLGATSNLNYGYFGGGTAPPSVDTIDRIDFSNEIVSLPGNNLPQGRYYVTGVSGGKRINAKGFRKGTDIDGKGISSTYGYVAGGTSPPDRSTIDRLDYSTDSITGPAVHGLELRSSRRGLSSFGNKNYGYFCNGFQTFSHIDRIDFSNETRSDDLTSTYPAYYAQSFSNSNYGYICGGTRQFPPSVTASRSTIERMDFETESLVIINSTLQNNVLSSSAAVSNPNYGYFGGGDTGSVSNTIERFEFSSETSIISTGTLSQKRYGLGSFQNSNYGYFFGGSTPTKSSIIDRLDFSTDLTTPPGNMPEEKTRPSGLFNSYHGYAYGGGNPPSWRTLVHRMDFSDETISLLTDRMTQERNQSIGLSN